MHPLNCKEVTMLLAMGDVQSLPWLQRLTVRFHLLICYVCRRYELQIRHIALAFRWSARQVVTADQVERVKTRIINTLSPQ